ncbi:MAG: polyprenol monophosphomannose synthase [Planctomycetota bacterium]|nr:polyprenol monophosphomannose synthase [Planctomycetota bacterium]
MNGVPLVAIATYNEIQNLPTLVDQVLQALPCADVLVIDDRSPDGTGDWCVARSQSEPRLKCLVRPGKLGLGTAHLRAIEFALEHQYPALLTMDADFSHPPHDLAELWTGIQTSDVVIGSRYVLGGSIQGWPFHRHVMSRLINQYARTWLRLPCRDCSGAFRAYRCSVLAQLALDQVESRGYAFFEEILWHLRRHGATFQEIPICFRERERGASKINLREARTAVWSILKWGIRDRCRR